MAALVGRSTHQIQGEQMKFSVSIFVVLVSVLGLTGCAQKSDAKYVGTENAAVIGKLRVLYNQEFKDACDAVQGREEDPNSQEDIALAKVLMDRAILRARVHLTFEQRQSLPNELHGLLYEGWICGSGRDSSIHFGDPVE